MQQCGVKVCYRGKNLRFQGNRTVNCTAVHAHQIAWTGWRPIPRFAKYLTDKLPMYTVPLGQVRSSSGPRCRGVAASRNLTDRARDERDFFSCPIGQESGSVQDLRDHAFVCVGSAGRTSSSGAARTGQAVCMPCMVGHHQREYAPWCIQITRPRPGIQTVVTRGRYSTPLHSLYVVAPVFSYPTVLQRISPRSNVTRPNSRNLPIHKPQHTRNARLLFPNAWHSRCEHSNAHMPAAKT